MHKDSVYTFEYVFKYCTYSTQKSSSWKSFDRSNLDIDQLEIRWRRGWMVNPRSRDVSKHEIRNQMLGRTGHVLDACTLVLVEALFTRVKGCVDRKPWVRWRFTSAHKQSSSSWLTSRCWTPRFWMRCSNKFILAEFAVGSGSIRSMALESSGGIKQVLWRQIHGGVWLRTVV